MIFYLSGSRGINIEPDPTLYKKIVDKRPNDINLNLGIAKQKGIKSFYILSTPTLNTFSKKEANRITSENPEYKLVDTKKIKVDSINNIINRYFKNATPDLLSIDVEGLDKEIITSLNFKKHTPTVICLETISYSKTGHGIKNNFLISYLIKKNYLHYADTNINSIFIYKKKWMC